MRRLLAILLTLAALSGACQTPHSATPPFPSTTALKLILYG